MRAVLMRPATMATMLGVSLLAVCVTLTSVCDESLSPSAWARGPKRRGLRGKERQTKTTQRALWREGTVIELTGRFQGGGAEPITFRPADGEEAYRVLENLSLHRVAGMLDIVKKRQWQITAVATEFKNSNYLLLQQVALKTIPDPATETAPKRISTGSKKPSN